MIPSEKSPFSATRTLTKQLARLRKHIFQTLTRSGPTPQDHHRQASAKLRRTDNLSAAELECACGIALYPTDLGLAIEYAKIADASKDIPLCIVRWQRVLELAGEQTPARAFVSLADCYPCDPISAEAILQKGLELHPADFSLLGKLGKLFSAQGLTAKAITAWQAAIVANPTKDLAPIYLKLGQTLREEGLLARSEMILRQGVENHPANTSLREALASVAFALATPSRKPIACDPNHPSTAHLFQDRYQPHALGTLAFSLGSNPLRQHVPALLDFAVTVPAPEEPGDPGPVDVFAVWGAPSSAQLAVRETAAAAGRPLLCLDSGLLSSPGIKDRDSPSLSVIITPDAVYYDATRPTAIVDLLNSETDILDEIQRARAQSCITSIVTNRLSKFNHAPSLDLRPRFPADGTRRILLVDQCKGGSSIHWSLGSQATFQRMLEDALARSGYQILIKIHPEVIAARSPSLLLPLLPSPLPDNVVIIDYDVNPHDLLEVVDEVFVATSQLGFEAVLAGKQVHCFAAPYYSGWGFTHDELAIPRRHRRRDATEIFHLYHIAHSRYFVPSQGVAEIEDSINYLTEFKNNPQPSAAPEETSSGPLKILIVLPSGRYGASGRYVQNLSSALVQLGCEILILAEGSCPRLEDGVRWLRMDFEGVRIAQQLRRKIVAFTPNFVYVNGFRSRTHRVALESVVLTGARLAMQSEDDDIQVHCHRRSEQAADQLGSLDRPRITTEEIARFLKNHDWVHSLNILLDPAYDRSVEPLMRILCYRMACVHTAIWHPYAERLARDYGVPTLVVPPVASPADFERITMTPQERAIVLGRYGIDPAATVIFIGGALYSYSDEFAAFLTALKLAAMVPAANFALVVTSGRSSLPLGRMAAEILASTVPFTDIGDATDAVYMEMLKACDIVCSPGLPDDFNRYRLPSRLVKAMAMAKPILTCRCGFGESLEHGHNAFLMDGEDPAMWVTSITLAQDTMLRTVVGRRGQDFARENFDSQSVATALKQQFEISLTRPARTLAAGIATDTGKVLSGAPSIRLKVDNSPLRAAMQALALRTNRLDTIVHIGAGECSELEAYCRLGARQIILAKPRPDLDASQDHSKCPPSTPNKKESQGLEDFGIRQTQVDRHLRLASCHPEDLDLLKPISQPRVKEPFRVMRAENTKSQTISEVCRDLLFSGLNDLLVLELQGSEVEALNATPTRTIQLFEWIVIHLSGLSLFEKGTTLKFVSITLKEIGFDSIPLSQNLSEPRTVALFRKQPNYAPSKLF